MTTKKDKDELMEIIYSGEDIDQSLLNKFKNLNFRVDSVTPLYASIDSADVGQININNVKLLLERGVDVNKTNSDDNSTPLYIACEIDSPVKYDVVKLLLLYGANPNIVTNMCDTCLMAASKTAEPEIVELLLKNGANPNIINRRDHNTAIDEAAKWSYIYKDSKELSNKYALCVKLLLEYGANPDVNVNRRDESRNILPLNIYPSAIFNAIKSNNVKMIKELINGGADIFHIVSHLDSIDTTDEIKKIIIDIYEKETRLNRQIYRPVMQQLGYSPQQNPKFPWLIGGAGYTQAMKHFYEPQKKLPNKPIPQALLKGQIFKKKTRDENKGKNKKK
jgi:ankyrin repeat protein